MQNIAFAFPSYYRPIAVVTLLALLAWATGLPSLLTAQAANVQFFSNTLSDSHPGADAIHTIEFTLVTAVAASETMRITFDPETQAFDLGAIVNGDVTITAAAGGPINQVDAVGLCSGAAGEIYVSNINTTDDYIELTVCTGDTIPAGTEVEIVVGSTNQIANPSAPGSYVIRLGGTMTDNGDTRVAIIENVTVTASVETIFEFSIHGVDEGLAVNGDPVLTSGSSTATSVPFGVIAPAIPKLMAQELRVNTNAINGFAVTVQADQTLTAGNGATIDAFVDGLFQPTPIAWDDPGEDLNNSLSWGHWGLTSDDGEVSAGAGYWQPGTEPGYVGNFIANPVEVFFHNKPVTYAQGGQGVGSTTVAYKVQITTLQEAATDYTATLTYIATPVF